MRLEDELRALRADGRKALAPYLVAGFPSPESFGDLLEGVVEAGADIVEIGLPFSDPLMDGPVIQRASEIALRAEMRPQAVLRTLPSLSVPVPVVLYTYVNPVLALGWEPFAKQAAEAGAAGVIVPDLPPEEGAAWAAAARAVDVAPVLLVGPTTTEDRVRAIVRLGSGFVYCVSLLGVTGVRESFSRRARAVVDRVRGETDRPALVGVGVSTPEHAVEACEFADGVVVGSALVRAVLEDGPQAGVAVVEAMRRAMDKG